MVVIQIKQGEHDTFLYETTCSIPNDQLIREIVKVWNLRLRIGQLIGCIQELAKYGPMKKPENAGIDSVISFSSISLSHCLCFSCSDSRKVQ